MTREIAAAVLVLLAIVVLFGWAWWDFMEETFPELREDPADFSWTASGLEQPVVWVLGPALYDWQAEGDDL